ncbi:MAG: hypothetical protein JXR52_11420 [Bacteroidales bacterium]|nr:hypothetical protein [Bacteroidales bacterium]MBN2699423.1 hypothetical protein [Bacteroidales bacterium]
MECRFLIIDYNDLSWSGNGGSYLGIIFMVLLMVSMVFSKYFEPKDKM